MRYQELRDAIELHAKSAPEIYHQSEEQRQKEAASHALGNSVVEFAADESAQLNKLGFGVRVTVKVEIEGCEPIPKFEATVEFPCPT